MKVLKVAWGLLVDDGRLASLLVIALIVAAIVSRVLHSGLLAAVIIMLGLVVSIWVSVEHQLQLKFSK